MKNCFKCWKIGSFFGKLDEKSKFFGASRQHLWGLEHFVGGDPPPQISDFMGGDFGFYGGGFVQIFFYEGGSPPIPPTVENPEDCREDLIPPADVEQELPDVVEDLL